MSVDPGKDVHFHRRLAIREHFMTKPDQDEQKTQPPKKPDEKLHRPAETLGEAPAGGPNATERSRLAD